MVFIQVFLFKEMIVTTSYIFLVNLIYFPVAIACLVREDPGSRRYEMIERWRDLSKPNGSKSIAKYMQGEMLNLNIILVSVYQIMTIVGLFFYTDTVFYVVNTNIPDWHLHEPLFVNQAWLNSHPED